MTANNLNLTWLPTVATFLSAAQCVRLLAYTVRIDTKARLLFTFGWSVVSFAMLLWANTVGSFASPLVIHGLTIGGSLVVIGWVLVGQAVIKGLAYVPPPAEPIDELTI